MRKLVTGLIWLAATGAALVAMIAEAKLAANHSSTLVRDDS